MVRRTANHKVTFDTDGFSRVTIEFQMIGMRPSPAITRCAQLEVSPIYGLSALTIYGETIRTVSLTFHGVIEDAS